MAVDPLGAGELELDPGVARPDGDVLLGPAPPEPPPPRSCC
jgi:hypothetical protein